MLHYYQDIYELAANLIQYESKEEILRIFRERLAHLLPGLRIELYETRHPNEHFQHIITIGTDNNRYGSIAIEGHLEKETVEHLNDTARLVAIRLEHIDKQKQAGLKNDLTESFQGVKNGKLQEAEANYRQLYGRSVDGIMLINIDSGRVLEANPMMCTLLGREYEDIKGHHHTEFAMAEYQDTLEQIFSTSKEETNTDHSFGEPAESIFIRPDGSSVATEVITQYISYGHNNEVIAGFFRDITKRKEYEKEIKKNEKRLSTLLANLPGMAYQCYNDRQWTMLFLSQGCKSLTEYEPEVLQRNSELSYSDLILKDDRAYVWETVQQSLENRQPFTVTYRITTRSGHIKWVWERGRCVKQDSDGKQILEGFISDITQQKQAEYQLKQNLARFKALINNLQSGVLVEDYSRKIINANQKLSDLFGAPGPDTMLGQDCGAAAKQISGLFIDPDYFISRIEKILENREIVINEELYLKDGRTFERDYVPVFIEDTFSGNMWIYRDITHQKEHEKAIKNSLEEKKTLLKEIHHRVKNNLSVITSLLKLQSATIPAEEQAQKALEETYNQIHSMAQVHEQLYQSDDFNSVDMYLYIESLISRLSQSYPTSANIDFQLKADQVTLDINRAIPCGLILNELITNSIKHAFADSDTGTVRINMTKNRADNLFLRIEDNGKGMPDHFNIEEADTLGLELVNMLVHQLDASIEIKNSDGVVAELNIPLSSTGL